MQKPDTNQKTCNTSLCKEKGEQGDGSLRRSIQKNGKQRNNCNQTGKHETLRGTIKTIRNENREEHANQADYGQQCIFLFDGKQQRNRP